MQACNAEATGVLERELKAQQNLQELQKLQGWPQANRLADCGGGPHGARVGDWELGGGQSKGYWRVGEGVCCDRD